eukprot:g68203.t1
MEKDEPAKKKKQAEKGQVKGQASIHKFFGGAMPKPAEATPKSIDAFFPPKNTQSCKAMVSKEDETGGKREEAAEEERQGQKVGEGKDEDDEESGQEKASLLDLPSAALVDNSASPSRKARAKPTAKDRAQAQASSSSTYDPVSSSQTTAKVPSPNTELAKQTKPQQAQKVLPKKEKTETVAAKRRRKEKQDDSSSSESGSSSSESDDDESEGESEDSEEEVVNKSKKKPSKGKEEVKTKKASSKEKVNEPPAKKQRTGKTENKDVDADSKQKDKEDEQDSEEEEGGKELLGLGIEEEDDADEGKGQGSTKLGHAKFDPSKAANWKPGKDVPYSALVELFQAMEAEPARLKKVSFLADFFRMILATTPAQLLPAVYLCGNAIAPAYEGLELGVGDGTLYKMLAKATGRNEKEIKAKAKDIGDLGLVAEQSRSTQKTLFRPPPLTVLGVFNTLKTIAQLKGKTVGDKKTDLIQKLLVACKGSEARYLVRGLQGKLRIGLAEKGILAGLARAVSLTPPGEVQKGQVQPSSLMDSRKKLGVSKFEKTMVETHECISQAYTEVPNHDLVIAALLQHGAVQLSKFCFLTPGVPVKVMLGKAAKGIEMVYERFGKSLFTIEWKYDGERAQIHLLPDGSFRIYSRNSENNTTKYPDLIAMLPSCYDAKTTTSFIIDCEVVAWDKEQQKILPFQTLSTRKRKDVAEDEISVQVCLFAFDLLFYNGKSYLNESFATRREKLWEVFKEQEGRFHFAVHKDTTDKTEVAEFMEQAVNNKCEGLMIKALHDNAQYVPDKRNWMKLKKDYLEGVGDTLDLVPIGAFRGKGKRTGWFGGFLMACYNEDTETYQSICKLGTGFKEEDLNTLSAFFKQEENQSQSGMKPYYEIPEGWEKDIDVWLEPKQVWEVLCADLSISPAHKAAVGLVDAEKGIALRFPRFLRVRPDKTCQDATTAEQVVSMFEAQAVREK